MTENGNLVKTYRRDEWQPRQIVVFHIDEAAYLSFDWDLHCLCDLPVDLQQWIQL
jgi:hypothetical protein